MTYLIAFLLISSGLSDLTLAVQPKVHTTSIEEHFSRVEEFLNSGNREHAVDLLNDLPKILAGTGFAYSERYISIVTKIREQSLYDSATLLFMMSLQDGHVTDDDNAALEKELTFFCLLIDNGECTRLKNELYEDRIIPVNSMREFWIRADPTPGVTANQRLIEHKLRIAEALNRFPNPDSETGVDSKGEVFIRYGQPDTIYDKSLNFSEGEIYGFVFDYYSSIESKLNAAMATWDLMEVINRNPFQTNLHIWVYNRFDSDMDDNLIFYFTEQKNSVFQRIRSLDAWIPRGLYSNGDARMAKTPFTPSMPLQFLAYQRLMHVDRQLMDIYNKMDFEIFNPPFVRSRESILNLSRQLKAENQINAHFAEVKAPREKSTEINRIPEIPLEINQYKFLDHNDLPVFTTFFESKPSTVFIIDLLKNQSIKYEDTEQGEISTHYLDGYHFEQGVELYDSSMHLKGRVRGNPFLDLDFESDNPSSVIINIPVDGSVSKQKFYSKLMNRNSEITSDHETIFPDDLKGLGIMIVPLPDHFESNENGILVSDILLGYDRIDEDELRFPFTVKHDRVLPHNKNLVVHFEVYRLRLNEAGFTDFEVEYSIEPSGSLRNVFRSNDNDLNGILEFTSGSNRFAESLEFEDLPLTPGRYTLTWTVRDLQADDGYSQELEFEVVEGY